MGGYRDDLRAAHERIGSLQRQVDEATQRANEEAAAAARRIEQLERQVTILEKDDAERALREQLERVEREASVREARDRSELEAATMKILALEEAAYQRAQDNDRAFAQIAELERTLAEQKQSKAELDTMTVVAVEETAHEEGGTTLAEMRRELSEARQELEGKAVALSRNDQEIEQLREHNRALSNALRESEQEARDAIASLKQTMTQQKSEAEAALAVIPPIQQTDDDIARLSPGGDWILSYRMPRALRSRRRQLLATGGLLVLLPGLMLVLQGVSLAAGATLLALGAVLVGVGVIAGPSVHRGEIERVQGDPSDQHFVVVRINGVAIRLPRDARPVVSSAKQAVIEQGSLGEGTFVVLTPAHGDGDAHAQRRS
jgi:hypothetical protein